MRKPIDIERIVDILKTLLPENSEYIPLHEPVFSGNEWDYVKECIDTRWVSSVGKYVDRFEQILVDFSGAKHAVAVVNGTAALHICLKLAGVKPNEEVLIPTLTFIATANAVTYCGAIPHFVDSEERTLGLDPYKLAVHLEEIAEVTSDGCFNKQTGRRIKAVVPMHTFGHPVDLDPLIELCERFKLELVEDAAESLGSYYKGKHTGTFGKVAALSFNGNKIVTTGGGGAILTNDEQLYKQAKHLTTTAKLPHRWEYYHDEIGYNYRMPNLNAALGCAQLEQLPMFIQKKRELAKRYQAAFSKMDSMYIFKEPDFAVSNYWLNVLMLNHDEDVLIRNQLLEKTNELGIGTRPVWSLIHQLEIYKGSPVSDVSNAISLANRIINIPSSASTQQS